MFLSLPASPPQLYDQWKVEQKQLEPTGLSKAAAPRSFLALIQSIRKASKADILRVLKSASKTSLYCGSSHSALSIQSLMIYASLEFKDESLTVSLLHSGLRWWTPSRPPKPPPRWTPCWSSSTSPTPKVWFCRRGSSTPAALRRIQMRRCWRRCWWVWRTQETFT